ncbi:RsfA family transcriptional regulator [Paenibacillus sp. LMG 31458]|uniref:RsfA family transcriptional regulator n=1 Tax=Paenibacillus phytorum TaxID=2654977 RepID=A0ABX1YB20_9BACL|nr:RsfA family transcriptional regulator [Paenibacillus phytorum]NOU77266.1 RsfA family transcriptional regulator [Paenibacillus phytorum]
MKDKKREDAWNDNYDAILAETVINHIKTGSTQLLAFEESGKKINRTAAACGFRWNKEIRKKYENEILVAKACRSKQKAQKREVFVTVSSTATSDNPWQQYDDPFRQIIKIAKDQAHIFEQLLQENTKLKNEIIELKSKKKNSDTAKTNDQFGADDIQTFLNIMNRARNLTSNLNV